MVMLGMVFYTPLDRNRQVGLYVDKLGLDLDGKTIRECVDIIIKECPQLHSLDYLRELARSNLKSIESEFGYKALRLHMYDTVKDSLLQSFTGKDKLQRKYEKLLTDVRRYHEDRLGELRLTLDIYNYYTVLEEVNKEEYGLLHYYNDRLYSLLKTLSITYYDENIVEALHDALYDELCISGDKYYIQHDLKDKKVLMMLFEHVAEENFDEAVVKGVNMLTDYDGYGNEYYLLDYQESWTDDEGYHSRSWAKESDIYDYIRVGLPTDF